MYLLDTNTVRFGLYEPHRYPLVVANLSFSGHETWLSIITVQELIAWRYNKLLTVKNQQPPQVLRAYKKFFSIIEDICSLPIQPFDRDAITHLSGMPGDVGIQDRRIAATALAHGFTVVSHDHHFKEIKRRKPKLNIVDWVDTPPAGTT